jgi:hypothetical protein
LFHARAEDGHHHLLERTEERLVVLAKHVIRGFLEHPHALLFFLLGCGIALPWQQYPRHLVLQIRDAASILLERQQTLLLKLVNDVLELLPLLWRKVFEVDIHEVCDFRHLESIRLLVPLGVPKSVLTQKVHSTPNTQQAEQSWLHTRREQKTCQSIFPEN